MPHSVDHTLEQLQKECPSFNIQQKYSRYCSLSGKQLSHLESLTCSIPVQILDDKVSVDCLALSKSKSCAYYSKHWTQVYSPTRAKHIIGNSSACSSLLHWLQCWERKCQSKNSLGKKKLQYRGKGNADFLDSDFFPSKGAKSTGEDACNDLLPAALLHGPHGSGKTAAVYACASESGFKVRHSNYCALYNFMLLGI